MRLPKALTFCEDTHFCVCGINHRRHRLYVSVCSTVLSVQMLVRCCRMGHCRWPTPPASSGETVWPHSHAAAEREGQNTPSPFSWKVHVYSDCCSLLSVYTTFHFNNWCVVHAIQLKLLIKLSSLTRVAILYLLTSLYRRLQECVVCFVFRWSNWANTNSRQIIIIIITTHPGQQHHTDCHNPVYIILFVYQLINISL